MFCTNCGNRNPEGSNFCGTCGAPLRSDPGEDTTVVTFSLETEGEGEEEFSVPMDELEEGKAIVVVRRGANAGAKFFLDKDGVPRGRNPPTDNFLHDVTVSRRPAPIPRKDSPLPPGERGSLD